MTDDNDLPIDTLTAAIECEPTAARAIGKSSTVARKENGGLRRPESVPQKIGQGGSPKEKLISVLTGGRRPDPEQEAIITAVEAGFGISEADPAWIFLLPPLLKNGRAGDVSEVRELVASVKASGIGKAGAGLEELSEAQRETAAAINAFNLKLEKSVERAVSAALAKSETGGGVDVAALSRSVSESIGSRLMPARVGLVAGALAFVAALAFLGGVMVNKPGYDKYIAELEGKIQGYQSVIGQQKGAAR